MFNPLQTKIVGKAIVIRYDSKEGTVNEIIENNYPNMASEDVTLVKAYIVSIRPEIDIDASAAI